MLEHGWKYEAVLVDAAPAGDIRELRLATTWATKHARQMKTSISVIAPEKRAFRDHPGLWDLPFGTFEQLTWRTIHQHELRPVIIACWPNEKLLADLDTLQQLRALCVVSHDNKEVLGWRVARRVIDLLNPAAPSPPTLIADPIVLAAMKSLTIRVDHGTMLAHSRGKAATVQMLQILRRDGYEFTTAELRAWAIANGWATIGASALTKIADAVLRGQAIAAGSPAWPSNILEQWREAAKGGAG
jgi:hypothetical protein